MRKPFILLPALISVVLATGCSKKEDHEYRFTPEQLAWQPYKTGDVLRFGRAGSAQVRTYAISQVKDEMVEQLNSVSVVVLWPVVNSRLQEIEVEMERTDTVRYIQTSGTASPSKDSILMPGNTLLSMRLDDDHGSSNTAKAVAALSWDYGYGVKLPLDALVSGQLLPDTTARRLPTLTLGNASYADVVSFSLPRPNPNPGPYPSPFPPTRLRRLYYAKNVGLVGFVDGGVLWYKLP